MPINIQLLIIDPEHDFCNPNGSLFVPGAPEDMDRLALMVKRLKNKVSDIHVTLDSHHPVDIAHAIWFVDAAGNHPQPFTQIAASDLKDRVWMTTKPGAHARTLAYLESLEAGQRYPHVIWPNHCIIGTEGTNVVPNLGEALQEWTERFGWVNFVTKGSNPWTEHFSAWAIAAQTQRTITEQLETDPIFYQKFSDKINEILEKMRKKKLADIEALKQMKLIKDEVLNKKDDTIPVKVQEKKGADIFFRNLEEDFAKHKLSEDKYIGIIINVFDCLKKEAIVDWYRNSEVKRIIYNKLDDYLYDEVVTSQGIALSGDEIKNIINKAIKLATENYKLF